jgi:tetratricopeptide (TPR) repeat protein
MNISKLLKASEVAISSNVIAICDFAKQLEDSGEYVKATQALGNWWQGVGIRPNVSNLSADEKAAILSRIGALTGWLGSTQQIAGSQEKAKDLISEAANIFERIEDHQNWAETRSDLAVCYWREGAFDEARVIIQYVLGSGFAFSPELKGKILLRVVTIEISAKQFETASVLINQVNSLIQDKENPLLLGKFYFYRAFILRSQGEDQNKPNLLLSAVNDYHKAGSYYKKAKHNPYVANVETNLGNLLRLLEDFKGAHSHLDKAIYLYVKLRDQSRAASVYDNKARTFIAQNNLSDAEFAARTSVSMLREGGEAWVLSESLITLGMVLSRGGNVDEAVRTFKEAKETALMVGDKESAGNAVLTYIEELQAQLTQVVFRSLYLEADELLKNSPKISTVNRLQRIARKQLEIGNPQSLLKSEKYFNWKNFSLYDAIHAYERDLILKALNESGGRVTKAAGLLGVSHQSLSQILHQRHTDLQEHRVQRKPRGSLKIKDQ